MTELKGKKMAVYLRRSKGESGTTSDQLEALESIIMREEKKGMKKVNRGIVGRDIKKERKGVLFEGPGMIFNEGDGFSGYNVAERPVFMELLNRLRDGTYDGVIAVSMDRFARNYGALSRYAYDLWGEENPGRLFYGESEKMALGEPGMRGAVNEKVLASLMDWGGLAKTLEIIKGEKKRTGSNIDKGYLLGGKPEWRGKEYVGKTSPGVDYRAVYEAIKAGEGSAKLGRIAKKYDKQGQPQTSFARTWKPRLQAYADLGVIEEWLENYEAVDEYIRNFGQYPKASFKSQEVTNLLKSTAGYFAYPKGVLIINIETGEQEFIQFPPPLKIGIERLANTKNPLEFDDFIVERMNYDGRELNLYQTQPRAGEGKKKKN